jgi:hypothetical protein
VVSLASCRKILTTYGSLRHQTALLTPRDDATPHQEPELSENGWQELYKAAILELDPMQLQDRVKAAESAITARASLGVQISRYERSAMDDALSALRMLKRGPGC